MELKSPEKEIEHDISFDNKGNVVLKKKSKVKRGRLSRARGARFELKVRNDLESDRWIVDKWTNNFDVETGEVVKARRKVVFGDRGIKFVGIGTGFPDFVAFKLKDGGNYDVVGVEVKRNGTLSKEEKLKCVGYLDKKIFRKILVAKEKKNGRNVEIEYADVGEILERMR